MLLDGDTLLGNRCWQLRQRQIDPILNLNLGDIRVGLEIEKNRNAHETIGCAGRCHIQQVVCPVDLCLDRRGYGIGNHFGVGAGIAGSDRDLNRRDRRIALDRQHGHGNQPGNADNKRYDRCKNWAFNEES